MDFQSQFQLKYFPLSVIFLVYFHVLLSYTFPLINQTYKFGHIDDQLPFAFQLLNILERYPLNLLPIEFNDTVRGVNLFLVQHILLTLGVYSALKTKFTNPGKISKDFSTLQEETIFKGLATQDPKIKQMIFGDENIKLKQSDAKMVVMAMADAGLFCKYCAIYTAPRSQHCHLCKQCVLKQEYHLPFLDTCIGYNNLKFYCLGLLYFFLAFVHMTFTYFKCFIESWVYKIDTWSSTMNTIVFLGLVAISLVFCYFIVLHYVLIKSNQTCAEKLDGQENKYDLGTKYNFQQVFGKDPFLWLIPVRPKKSKGKGLSFKEKSD